jgi:hypothetical protein
MLTGQLSYQIADKKLKVDPATDDPVNNGIPNTWFGGLSLQYSLRYLSSQVKDYGFSTFQQADAGGRAGMVVTGQQAE